MLRRRLKSALFIDFENVQLDPDGLANVLAWLEDGCFDGGRARKLLVKTVYWNSTAEKHRARYEALGVDVVLCEKYANLKNGADIRIAMDMVEARMRRPNIQEFILISKDSDFVPVLERLRDRKRRTTVLVDESKPAIHTVYTRTADTTFPIRRLMDEGRKYVRPKRTLLERLGFSAAKPAQPLAALKPVQIPEALQPKPPPGKSSLDLAVEKVVVAAGRNGGQSTGRQSITKELKSLPGFATNGTQRYFGYGSYEALIRAVAAKDARIALRDEKGGGMSVVFAGAAEVKPEAAKRSVSTAVSADKNAAA